MDIQEIRAQVESIGKPSVVRHERYEDSGEYIGPVFGARSAAPSPIAEALRKALDLDREEQPSGCDCIHCECGR